MTYHMAKEKKEILFYSELGIFLMVPSPPVLILWAPKSILVISILHIRCIILLNPLAKPGIHSGSPVKSEVEGYCLCWVVLERDMVL